MAVHGKATVIYMNGYALTSFLNAVTTPMTAGTAETTCFGSSDKTFIPGDKDATLSASGFYEGSTSSSVDPVVAGVLGASSNVWNWYPGGDAVGNQGFGMKTVNNNYEINSPADGAIAVTAEGQSVTSREAVKVLRALAASSTSGSGTSNDNTSATTKGGSGYLHVTSVATGNVAATVQHSSAGTSWATLLSFSATTGRSGQRVASTGGSVKRYTRANWTKSSTGAATFHVSFFRR